MRSSRSTVKPPGSTSCFTAVLDSDIEDIHEVRSITVS